MLLWMFSCRNMPIRLFNLYEHSNYEKLIYPRPLENQRKYWVGMFTYRDVDETVTENERKRMLQHCLFAIWILSFKGEIETTVPTSFSE